MVVIFVLQFRSSFVQPTQQYPVPPGTGFYPSPNPGEYPYGKIFIIV